MGRRRRQRRTADLEAADLDDLTWEQVTELVCGPYIVAAFESEEERTRQYLRHRTVLLEEYGNHGFRPWMWWMHEHGEAPPPPRQAVEGYPWPWDAEAVRLAEMGELRTDERKHLDETAEAVGR